MLMRLFSPVMLLCLCACQAIQAQPRQVDDYTWEGVERIVAIGDIHGDYDNYIEALRLADLVNRRGNWTGGTTHLVQTGDIPDRGPDTREIMEHIDRLAEQAEKAGGRVHLLLGNHEAMNLYGDLRYVTTEEFEDFAGRNSRALLNRYYDLVLQDMEQNDPEAFAALPENHREEWEATHPPGFVEHRQAWDPNWNPEGQYAQRTLGLKVAVKINGNLFLHGGISDLYADRSLASLSEEARASLADFNYQDPGMVEDPCGPLWFRGLSGEAPQVSPELLDSILERTSAQRIVVGHTPTPGIIWPRYDGRVIQIDTGLAEHYGGRPAYLEITADGLFAGYPEGKLPIPQENDAREKYFESVQTLEPENSMLRRFKAALLQTSDQDTGQESAETEQDATESAEGETAAAEGQGSGPDSEEQPGKEQQLTCLREVTDESAAPAL